VRGRGKLILSMQEIGGQANVKRACHFWYGLGQSQLKVAEH